MSNDDRPGLHTQNVTKNLVRLSAIGAVSLIRENERLDRERRLLEACVGFYREAVGELRDILDVFPDLDDRTVLSEARDQLTRDQATISGLKAEIKALQESIKANATAVRPAGSRKRK